MGLPKVAPASPLEGNCYYQSNNGADVSLNWWSTPGSNPYFTNTGASSGFLVNRNLCYAPQGTGTQYYANIRFSYTSCGTGSCGESIQVNQGPY